MDNNGQGGAPVGDNQQNTTPEVKQQASISPAFVGRSRFGSGRSISNYEREKANFDAAQNIVSNPNTPDFFGQAVMSNTNIPVAPKSNNKKMFIIGGVVVALMAVLIVVLVTVSNNVSQNDPSKPIVTLSNNYSKFRGLLVSGSEDAKYRTINPESSLALDKEIASTNGLNDAYCKSLKKSFKAFRSETKANKAGDEKKRALVDKRTDEIGSLLDIYIDSYKFYNTSYIESTYVKTLSGSSILTELQNNREKIYDKHYDGKIIYQFLEKYVVYEIKRLDFLNKNECIADGKIKTYCVEFIDMESSGIGSVGEKNIQSLYNSIRNTRTDLIHNIQNLDVEILGKSSNEE